MTAHPPAGRGTSPADDATITGRAPAGAPLSLRQELGRKALHVTSGAAPLAYAAGLTRTVMLAGLGLLCALALGVELARARLPAAERIFERTTGPLLRAHERRHLVGATWLLLAFLASVLLFPPRVAIAAMLGVALGDASAAVVGRGIGRVRLRGSVKSLEGSVACCLTTFLGAWLVAGLGPGESAVGALAATAAEWPARPFDDNMRIALATGAGILLWRLAFS